MSSPLTRCSVGHDKLSFQFVPPARAGCSDGQGAYGGLSEAASAGKLELTDSGPVMTVRMMWVGPSKGLEYIAKVHNS